jgi:RNA polymerase sigma factor (TIGR02999 family)
MSDVTIILGQIEAGEPQAASRLLPLIYDELRKLAAGKMSAERIDHTLQDTALVHEAYLRLVGSAGNESWDSRGHFFAAAAEAMRRILVERARQHNAAKRGGQAQRVELEPLVSEVVLPLDEMLDFNDALSKLEESDAQAAKIVNLRVFAGLTVEETAAALGIPVRSAYRDWSYAQAWLFRAMQTDVD